MPEPPWSDLATRRLAGRAWPRQAFRLIAQPPDLDATGRGELSRLLQVQAAPTAFIDALGEAAVDLLRLESTRLRRPVFLDVTAINYGNSPGQKHVLPRLHATLVGRMVEVRGTGTVSDEQLRQDRPPNLEGGMMVALSNVRFGKRNDDVKVTQMGLIEVGISIPAGATGFFGEQTRSAYAEWQRKLGFTGSAADGFPGCSSLAKLGARTGFAVDCRHPGAITKGAVRFSKNSGVATGKPTARQFAEQACDRTGAPRSWVTGVDNGANLLTLMLRESTFTPNAVNPDDSNATGPVQVDGARLNCSRGYAQVIPSTFAANHQAGTSDRIYDPVANVAAAINYIWRRYGDISRVQQANPHRDPAPY
ncbi:hypothetical protein E5082_09715 [Streptomyces griseoluteus]|uniref:Transglycosylase SLT domain-containing protein n=1 Tax=Streptomyces griseoluteus TaxID=29306 RepID=A0A4Z1DNJ1_STRGP|nr:transglycosylase SLT domain-containing protein [Streptomyces griseoluteus]TGN84652.1 hypothetical protein E5082_09715 [Streptomyces griseoluteus]